MSTTQRDLRTDTDPAHVRAIGAIRRMAIAFTNRVLWQLTGARLPDGVETRQAEPFTGIGFFARPPRGSRAEAVVLNLGANADSPVIVGVRDEGTRAKVAGNLAEDESAAFNSRCIVYIKADGTIEARSANGTAVPLALKSDVQHVDAKYTAHVHQINDLSLGAPTSGPLDHVPPNPAAPPNYLPNTGLPLAAAVIVGTTVLKGE